MSAGRPTLGDLIIKISLAYQTIRDIRITSEEGKHGCLKAILEIEEPTNAAQAVKLTGQAVEVSLKDGTRLFTGECTGAGLTSQGGYQCICLTAATRSVRMDRKKQKRTFQDPGKTLASVCSEIGGIYGAFITIGQDLPLSQVLSQQDETDWEFLLRIAAASGKVIYTDPLAEGIRIFVGETGFRRHGEDILEAECGITRNLAEMASIEANQGEAAEGYMVDRMESACSILTATAGDTAGISVIRKGEISQKGGLLQNHVSYGYPESVRPSAENALQPGFASGVLQGSVLAVSQNQIQVKFTSDKGAGETTWIPYESFFSNSFYCMPDEGDQVYVYYENNGKIACLGSRHTQTSHPDFARPEEKTLTSQDKMIRLTESGIKLTATREQTDQESDQAVAIYMDEKDGITIQSGRQITWEAKKSIRLGVDVPKEADASQKAGAEKLKERVKTGKKQFETEGGYVALAASQFYNQQKKQIVEFGKSMIFYDLWHKEGEEQAGEALDAEQFESGVLTLYGQSSVTLIVGDKSSIKLGEDIQIQTGEFRWLGYEQGEHAKEEKPLQDWWETALDGLQLALDIAGCIPVLGAIPDLINAGISLCRGDLMGAAMSAVAAIPIVGEAATAVKLGAKAVKTVTKLTKAKRMLSIAKGVFLLSQSAYMIYQSRDGLAEIWKKLENGENPFTDPACVSTMLNTLNSCVMGARGVKSIGDGVIGKKNHYKVRRRSGKTA